LRIYLIFSFIYKKKNSPPSWLLSSVLSGSVLTVCVKCQLLGK